MTAEHTPQNIPGRSMLNLLSGLSEMQLLELASPTPGCSCDTCKAIRSHRKELARAGSHKRGLK
jgi:hypothetical protein